jgi:hypothetical protein
MMRGVRFQETFLFAGDWLENGEERLRAQPVLRRYKLL